MSRRALLVFYGSIALLLILQACSGGMDKYRLLSQTLDKADSYIQKGDNKRALSVLKTARKYATSSAGWLSIAKRERNLQAYKNASDTLSEAIVALPANETIAAVYLDTLVLLGSSQRVRDIASTLINTTWAPLSAYAILSTSNLQNPLSVEPSWWRAASDYLNDEGMRKNAAVLFASSGDTRAAQFVLERRRPEQAVDALLYALIAYDSGSFSAVEDIYPDLTEPSMTAEDYAVVSDCYLSLEEPEKAADLWNLWEERFPGESAVPGYNLANFSRSVQNKRGHLERTLMLFPTHFPSVSAYLSLYLSRLPEEDDLVQLSLRAAGFTSLDMVEAERSRYPTQKEVERVLGNAVEMGLSNPDMFDDRILAEYFRYAYISDPAGSNTQTLVWNYLEKYPDSPLIFKLALWYLTVTGKQSAAFELNESGTFPIDPFYEGFKYAMEGRLAESLDEFSKCADEDALSWHALANSAVIEKNRKNYSQAISLFAFAAETADDVKTASRLHYEAAVILYEQRLPDRAKQILEYALDLDPGNFRASALYRAVTGY